MQDGMAAHLEPVTTNPVDNTLMKLKSMDRLIVGTHIVNEMKSQGLLNSSRVNSLMVGVR